jgi:hypothetical protein
MARQPGHGAAPRQADSPPAQANGHQRSVCERGSCACYPRLKERARPWNRRAVARGIVRLSSLCVLFALTLCGRLEKPGRQKKSARKGVSASMSIRYALVLSGRPHNSRNAIRLTVPTVTPVKRAAEATSEAKHTSPLGQVLTACVCWNRPNSWLLADEPACRSCAAPCAT